MFSTPRFAKFLKKMRETKGISLRQAAEATGLLHTRCYALENGHARLSVPQLVVLAGAYGFRTGSAMLSLFEKQYAASVASEQKKAKQKSKAA